AGYWVHTAQYGWIFQVKTPDQPLDPGQWVFTAQYGWLWMPYGAQYVREPSVEGTYPQSYVYHPTYGWTWVVSPWVWGWGPVPFYGYYGPWHLSWYRGPTFVHPGWGDAAYRGGSVPPLRETRPAAPMPHSDQSVGGAPASGTPPSPEPDVKEPAAKTPSP